MLGVVRGHQRGDVDEIFGSGGLSRTRIGHRSILAPHYGLSVWPSPTPTSTPSPRSRRPSAPVTLTARAATEAALARIAERDPAIGAFQVVRSEAALREADAVDQRADRFSLPLAGVPIAIKDNIAVSGEPMRNGSAATDSTAHEFDHELVRRLRRAGAVVVGLTRVPELCVYGATDSVFGITRNPWNRDRTPGGSSGGAAAAVRAGMVAAAHGNDGMGSIRIPAACCGLVGIKPGHGVVPAGLGNGSWFDMAENGPLATTVADCALLLSVMAGRPNWPRWASPGRCGSRSRPGARSRACRVDRSWAEAAPQAAGVFREAGHTVRQANPPYGQLVGPSASARWTAGTELDARLLADRSRLAPPHEGARRGGAAGAAAGFPNDAGRERWRRRAEAFFADHDVLVTPALAQSPIRSVAWAERGWLPNLRRQHAVRAVRRALERGRLAGARRPDRSRTRRDATRRATGRQARQRGDAARPGRPTRAAPALAAGRPGVRALVAEVERCHLVDHDGVDDPLIGPVVAAARRTLLRPRNGPQRVQPDVGVDRHPVEFRAQRLEDLVVDDAFGQPGRERAGQAGDAPAAGGRELERVEHLDGDQAPVAVAHARRAGCLEHLGLVGARRRAAQPLDEDERRDEVRDHEDDDQRQHPLDATGR